MNAVLAVEEVVRHPLGGWTRAVPVDPARSAARVYCGWAATRRGLTVAGARNLVRPHTGGKGARK